MEAKTLRAHFGGSRILLDSQERHKRLLKKLSDYLVI